MAPKVLANSDDNRKSMACVVKGHVTPERMKTELEG